MIKINLLPVREWRKKEAIRQQISVYFLSLMLLLIALSAVGITIQGKVSRQRQEITQLEAKKAKLAYVNKTIQQVQKKRKELETKFKAIEDLQKGRTESVMVLDEVVSSIPMDRVWLTDLSLKGGKLNLSGVALDNHTVALFMRRLEASDLCQGVVLQSTMKKTIEGHDLMGFALKVSISSQGGGQPGNNAAEKGKGK